MSSRKIRDAYAIRMSCMDFGLVIGPILSRRILCVGVGPRCHIPMPANAPFAMFITDRMAGVPSGLSVFRDPAGSQRGKSVRGHSRLRARRAKPLHVLLPGTARSSWAPRARTRLPPSLVIQDAGGGPGVLARFLPGSLRPG